MNALPNHPGPSGRFRGEHLSDRLFAALGYAFAIGATTAGLLTAHLGRLAIVTGIGLLVVLVPVNLSLIRRAARPHYAPKRQHRVPPREPHSAAQRRTSSP